MKYSWNEESGLIEPQLASRCYVRNKTRKYGGMRFKGPCVLAEELRFIVSYCKTKGSPCGALSLNAAIHVGNEWRG